MSSPCSTPAHTASIDIVEMRRRLADDSELIQDVARAFLDALPGLCADVIQARDQDDAVALRRAVHRLKGALLDVSAFQAAEIADQIELANVARHKGLPTLLARVEEAAQGVQALLAPP